MCVINLYIYALIRAMYRALAKRTARSSARVPTSVLDDAIYRDASRPSRLMPMYEAPRFVFAKTTDRRKRARRNGNRFNIAARTIALPRHRIAVNHAVYITAEIPPPPFIATRFISLSFTLAFPSPSAFLPFISVIRNFRRCHIAFPLAARSAYRLYFT